MQLTWPLLQWKRVVVTSLALLSITWTCSHYPVFAESKGPWTLVQDTVGIPKEAVHTKDGGFALLQAASREFTLTKTSPEGVIEWIRTLTPELPSAPGLGWSLSETSNYSLQQGQNGGFVITGAVDWYKHTDFYMITTDAEGRYLDTTLLSNNRSGSLLSFRMTQDGGYILAAQVERNMASAIMIKKFTSSGEFVWESSLPYNQDGPVPALQLTPDGGYVISGSTITKLDSSGHQLWNRSNPELFPSASRVIETPDHNLISIQTDGYTLKASKIDQNDQILWTTNIKTGVGITIEDVQLTLGGDLYIGGNIMAGHSLENEYIVALHGDGSHEEFKYLGGGWTQELLIQVIPLSNKEFVTYGTSDGYGYLVKASFQPPVPDPEVPVAQLKLDSVSYSLIPGDMLDTRLIVQDQQGRSKDVTSQGNYVVDDSSIALVDKEGNITGIRPGETILHAFFGDQTVTAKIYVFKSAVNGLKLDSDEYSLMPGESLDTRLTVKDGAGVKDVTPKGTYSTGNPKVAVVDSEGNITATGHGETVLTASYQGVEVTAKVIVY
ncbi:hypothetical protein [Paenibacillus sp. YPG26]|uniref:hypothetical protein n=1 Tax=Paenibacillus sp. YPG26 TaxID=2878915 RepID=UPI00203D9E1F|nr:hypothetical protein [Paenibacillus sp. YPG26]USB32447.1 hypothetical protein LDO05_14225 [Paenibacillus sp. YPG26]